MTHLIVYSHVQDCSKDASQSIKGESGLDGFNPAFYHQFWSIVGGDVTIKCLQILHIGSMPPNLNKIS